MSPENDRLNLEGAEKDYDPDRARRDREDFSFRRSAELFAKKKRPDLFLDLVQTSSFLADQADRLGGFTRTAEDLERFALPTAIALAQWPRFLRFATVASNLRGVAADLADEEMAVALARGGRFDLAVDAAERIADRWSRTLARIALAREAPGLKKNKEYDRLINAVIVELDRAAAANDAEALPALVAFAGDHGQVPGLPWERWIGTLAAAPESALGVRRALAEAWLDLGQPNREELWRALAGMGDLASLLDFAPRRLGDLALPDDAPRLLERLDELFAGDSAQGARAAARFLAAFSARHRREAEALWLARSAPTEWTAELADDLLPLLPGLPVGRLKEYAENAPPEARAALLTAALRASPGPETPAAAVAAVAATAAVHEIADPAARLHRALRFLEARSRTPDGAAKDQLLAVAGYLDELQFEAATDDLIRFVDLAAELPTPNDLGVFLDGIAWAPSADGARLLQMARNSNQDRVLTLLAQHAERYAAAVSKTQAEGFSLRGQLRGAATLRRCLLERTLAPLSEAIELLLPDEEDEMRFELARAFAREAQREKEARRKEKGREWEPGPDEPDPPGVEPALKVAAEIRDRRKRLLARLEAEAAMWNAPAPRARDLYAALARIGPLTDEARGLGLLFEPPFDPVEVADRRLAEITERPAEVRALLRLAEHSLAFQQRFPPRLRDLLAPLELLRARIGFENDDELAAATPDVALIAARLNPKRADLELGEAARRLLGLETVRWENRLAAFSRLVGIVRRLLAAPEFAKPAGKALAAMSRLPNEIEPQALRDQLVARWPEVAPAFTAEISPEGAPAESEWLKALDVQIGEGEIDPNSTALSPILHRLWACDENESRQRLANAVLGALASGGRPRGEAALRLFLHAHLAPRLGSDRPDKESDLAEALAAFDAALSLAPVAREEA